MRFITLKERIKSNHFVYSLLRPIIDKTYDKFLNSKRSKAFHENGVEALYRFDDAMNELGIQYWLCFGTLLGAVREKAFISHDFDMDLGLFIESYSPDNQKVLEKHGFKKTRVLLIDEGHYGREETYTYKGVGIDLVYFHKLGKEIYCHLFTDIDSEGKFIDVKKNGGLIVREVTYPFSGFKKIDFYGRNFKVPKNTHEVLACDYGEEYMTPNPNYVGGVRKNVKYLDDKVGILKKYS